MSNIAAGMETICKDIVGASEDRKKCLQNVKRSVVDLNSRVGTLRGDAVKLLNSYRKSRAEKFKELKDNLSKGRQSLASEVRSLRKSFQKSRKDLRQDLAETHRVWREAKKGLFKVLSG
ncbi:MAG: hypothetical protein ABIH08_08065 [Candidatus Omnitrophota bacterium]